MGFSLKSILNAPKKIAKGAKRLVTDPGKWAQNAGKSAGGAMTTLAPAAMLIPGVGPLAAAGLAAGGTALGRTLKGQSTFGRGGIQEILTKGAIGGAGNALLGGKGIAGLGGVPGKLGNIGKAIGSGALNAGKKVGGFLGNTARNTFMTEGGLDLGRLGGLATGAASMVGKSKDNKAAQSFNDSNAKLRQMLMERILEKPNYNFQ